MSSLSGASLEVSITILDPATDAERLSSRRPHRTGAQARSTERRDSTRASRTPAGPTADRRPGWRWAAADMTARADSPEQRTLLDAREAVAPTRRRHPLDHHGLPLLAPRRRLLRQLEEALELAAARDRTHLDPTEAMTLDTRESLPAMFVTVRDSLRNGKA